MSQINHDSQEFDPLKFEAMVHYVCEQADNDDFGAVKLNKVLWYSDLMHYLHYGKSISGSSYVRRKMGPVPATVLKTLDSLESKGRLEVKGPQFQFDSTKYNSLESADVDSFVGEEQAVMDSIVNQVCEKYTASSISDLTHNSIWKLLADGDEIPMHAYFGAYLGKPNEDTIAWANEVVAAL